MSAHIYLNGRPHTLPETMTVTNLLALLQMAGKPVVVELDQRAVLPSDYPETTVQDGSHVEIVAIAAGG